jgi:hypothetical protein
MTSKVDNVKNIPRSSRGRKENLNWKRDKKILLKQSCFKCQV